jgi:tight adherence protein B
MTAWILILSMLVILIAGLTLYGLTRALNRGDEMQDRIQTYALIPVDQPRRERGRRRPWLARFRLRLNAMLSSLNSEALSLELTRANWRISVTEFILIRFGISIAALLLGWFTTRSLLPGVGLALIAYMVPGVILRRRISKRQIAFEKQLVDVLVLINGAVRAGFSLLQATEVVVQEMKPPASDEFRRVVHESGLGLSLPQALTNLATRMENDDLNLVVTAIEIQHRVGGNLATMLSAVTDTIRERMRLFGEVRVLTTQQRYTSYLLSVLPIFIGSMLFIMNPDYMSRLFEPGPLICIPIGAIIGVILGHITIQRIVRIEV